MKRCGCAGRRSSGLSTSTDFVRTTNGAALICSSTFSKCRMSAARMRSTASASPETVLASTTSGKRRSASRMVAGGVRAPQNSST